jgi:hypothetical protein
VKYVTVNYLFATYLQTKAGGNHRIVKIEKVRKGKSKFFFNLSEEEADRLKVQYHNSDVAEFERLRRQTIELAL